MKIKDRIVLGIVAGLIGNAAKTLYSLSAIKIGEGKVSPVKKAAGMFLNKRQMLIKKRQNSILGVLADNTVGAVLGIFGTYLLTFTGKDHYRLKGLGLGNFAWVSAYGVLSTMGATRTKPLSVEDNIRAFFTHSVYGLVTSEMIVRLGDERLFAPRFLKPVAENNIDDPTNCPTYPFTAKQLNPK